MDIKDALDGHQRIACLWVYHADTVAFDGGVEVQAVDTSFGDRIDWFSWLDWRFGWRKSVSG